MDLQYDKSFDDKLETIIAFATMIYIVETILYESHPTDEEVFNDFVNDKQICIAKST